MNDSAQHYNTCPVEIPTIWECGLAVAHGRPHFASSTVPANLLPFLSSTSPIAIPTVQQNHFFSPIDFYLVLICVFGSLLAPPHAANTSDCRPHETLSSPSYPTPPRQPFPWFSSARQLPPLSPQWIIIWRLTRRVRQSHTTFRRRPILGRFLPSMAGLRI